jgi:hypothetical protein
MNYKIDLILCKMNMIILKEIKNLIPPKFTNNVFYAYFFLDEKVTKNQGCFKIVAIFFPKHKCGRGDLLVSTSELPALTNASL